MRQIDEVLAQFAAAGPVPKIVTLTTRTYPPLLKKNRVTGEPCPYRGVHRICRRNGIIGCSYENAVNNQRVREAQPTNRQDEVLHFHALDLWNGKGRHDGPYTVKHVDRDTRYIVFKPAQKKDGSLIVNADVWQDEAGNVLNVADLEHYLPKLSESKRQQVDKPVAWRTIELDNILAVTYGEEISFTG